MSQQHPQWGQPPQHHQQQPPAWGAPQGPPPGWGGPPPRPPKKNHAGVIVGVGVAVVALIAFIAASAQDDAATSDDAGTSISSDVGTDDAPAAAEPEESAAAPAAPVKVTAKRTAFTPGILADGTAYTSVSVTIRNGSDEPISINPLYITITDTDGTKHTAELGADTNQLDTVDLEPGENVTGVVTGKGRFTAKYVTYTDGLLGDSVRGNVS
ncbi:DUF4352 domain-containing protein [Streptomyces fructofermentans]|uniref:DUF4352 domain-containing protein n=1 Tax=Streptomyces fructofermentans TaxID=152141 RepID=A0A918NV94_9ACTN|nr:DUF4352 domain-containing protein [Streptomyces fructofermentans]GGX99259.1 hypothetical protein GCM10010515_76810 [Streptomyces fructofermentans]